MTLAESLKHKYNLQYLFPELVGKKLDVFSDLVFNDPAQYAAQRPVLEPLGKLYLSGSNGGRGMALRWTNEDASILIDTDRRGVVTYVQEAKS